MTAIVIAKSTKNKCIAASDRRISDSTGMVYLDAHSKVQKMHSCLIGSAGDVAPFEVFLTLKSMKNFKQAENKMSYLLFMVLPQFKKALKTLVLTQEDDALGLLNTDIIICHQGLCYNIAINGSHGVEVSQVSLPAAFGCGGPLALAALKGIQLYNDNNIAQQLTWALEIAATMDNACDANIDIIKE